MAQGATETLNNSDLEGELEVERGLVREPGVIDAPRTPVARRKLHGKTILLALGILAVAGAATAIYLSSAGWESTDDAQIDGYVNPISSRVAGYVTHVHVDDNQVVKAGTVLAEIDPKDYQVALNSAQATLANDEAAAEASRVNVPLTSTSTSSAILSAQAMVDNARAGESAAEQQLAAARASLLQAQAQQARAQDDVDRFKPLAEKQEIAEQEYTQAVDSEKAAAAATEGARAAVQGAQHQVTQARAKLDQATAELASARTGPQQVRIQQSRVLAATALVAKSKAAVEQAQLNLNYTRIVAPVDGIVARRSAQPGEYVTPGEQLLAIVPLADIWVTANFKETQLQNMRPGQPVTVHVDAFGRDYSGHVESMAGGTGAVFSLLPRKMLPATTSRSCNACRSESASTRGKTPSAACGQASPWNRR